jgi:hypothetical protein
MSTDEGVGGEGVSTGVDLTLSFRSCVGTRGGNTVLLDWAGTAMTSRPVLLSAMGIRKWQWRGDDVWLGSGSEQGGDVVSKRRGHIVVRGKENRGRGGGGDDWASFREAKVA